MISKQKSTYHISSIFKRKADVERHRRIAKDHNTLHDSTQICCQSLNLKSGKLTYPGKNSAERRNCNMYMKNIANHIATLMKQNCRAPMMLHNCRKK